MNDKKRQFVIHPLFFALFPVLSLYSYNIGQIEFTKILLSMALVPAATLILFLILGLILRNFVKTGIIISAFVLMFFTYGHLSDPIRGVVFMLFLIGLYFLYKTKRQLTKLTYILNAAAIVLIIIPFFNIATFQSHQANETEFVGRPELIAPELSDEEIKSLPDIYYIILDGFARQDILEEIYRYNESEFLALMKNEGFYIPDSSRSNYCQTVLSLASTLNLSYLDSTVARLGVENDNRDPLKKSIKNSYVFEFLKQYGYKTAAFASGYTATEIKKADYYYSRGLYLNEFEHMLLSYTPIPRFLKKFSPVNQWEMHRKDILFTFDKLLELPEIEEPLFTFAHIIAPHPPFVFDRDGGPIDYECNFDYSDGSHYMKKKGATPQQYLHNYREQVNYISNKVLTLASGIKVRTRNEAVIILQADHGPGALLFWEKPEITYFKERLTIFSAFYLPGGSSDLLYNKITPVNIFRIIFNRYFHADFELLDDRSYFSTWEKPFEFIDVTELLDTDTGNKPRYKGLH